MMRRASRVFGILALLLIVAADSYGQRCSSAVGDGSWQRPAPTYGYLPATNYTDTWVSREPDITLSNGQHAAVWMVDYYRDGIGESYGSSTYYVTPETELASANPRGPFVVGYDYSTAIADANAVYGRGTAVARMDNDRQDSRTYIDVQLPSSDAEFWIDGQKMMQNSGAVREFYTPPLDAGSTYSYNVRARWKDANGRNLETTEMVQFQPGERIWVDLSNPRTTYTSESAPMPGQQR